MLMEQENGHHLTLVLCLFKRADFQSCLICVARRVPVKERPAIPTYESFTTRQDLQGRTEPAGAGAGAGITLRSTPENPV